MFLGKETGRIDVPDSQSHITFLDMVLEVGVNLDCPVLLGFLFYDGEGVAIHQHSPCKSFRIAYTQSEECTAANV